MVNGLNPLSSDPDLATFKSDLLIVSSSSPRRVKWPRRLIDCFSNWIHSIARLAGMGMNLEDV